MCFRNFKISILLLSFISQFSFAISKTPPPDFDEKDTTSKMQSQLINGQLGDNYDPSTGAVSFAVTDIDLPGNFNLPVQLRRKASTPGSGLLNIIKGWGLDVPFIKGHYIEWSESSNLGTYPPLQFNGCRDAADLGFNWAGTTGAIANFTYAPGRFLNIPGKTSGFISKSLSPSGHSTIDNFKIIECPSSSNGQAVVVQGPDGTKYTFDHHINTQVGFGFPIFNSRYKKMIMATEVEDRFGNTVTYNYAGDKLDSISASDGRLISFSYQNGNLKTATANGRVWTYNYHGSTESIINARDSLHTVTRPDNLFWNYPVEFYLRKEARTHIATGAEPTWYCGAHRLGQTPPDKEISFTVTTPEKITLNYTMDNIYHGKSNITPYFDNGGPYIGDLSTTGGYPSLPNCMMTQSLTYKSMSGAGLSSQTWTYTYSQNTGRFANVSTWTTDANNDYNTTGNVNNLSDFTIDLIDYKPSTIGELYDVKTTTVAVTGSQSGNKKTVYYIDRDVNSVSEGKPIAVDEFNSSDTLLRRTEFTYSKSPTQILDVCDISSKESLCNGMTNGNQRNFYNRLSKKVIKLYDENNAVTTYQTDYLAFDSYNNPTTTKESSSANVVDKYTQQSYYNDSTNWVLSQPTTTKVSTTNSNYTTVKEIEYYPSNDANFASLPKYSKSYGTWQAYYSDYHADGNLKKIEFNDKIKNASGTATSTNRYEQYSNYKRGTAQTITKPARYSHTGTTNAYKTIDNNGWLTREVDFENNGVDYGYDSMGRLQYIDPDDANTADTFITWDFSGTRPVQTFKRCTLASNKESCFSDKLITESTYDGLLRATKVKTTDVAANNSVYQSFSYNIFNETTFESFASSYSSTNQGKRFYYDPLGRLDYSTVNGSGGSVQFDYLSGNRMKVTDQELNVTTTTYLAYGAPSYELATFIDSPESVDTSLDYNIFGNVTSITQSGPGKNGTGTVTQTEYRAYDDKQRLCKVSRQDIGNKVFAYNNIRQNIWFAEGVSGGTNTNCTNSATSSMKVHNVYDNHGVPWKINYGDSTPDKTFTLDDNGDLESITAGNLVQNYYFNSARLLDYETHYVDGNSYTLDYSYDSLGALSSLKYPDNSLVSFAPNAFGQPTKATQAGQNFATQAEYYPTGQLDTFLYGNGVIHKTTLNSRKITENIRDYKGSSDKVELGYTYDNNLNIKSISDGINSSYSLSNLSYDGLDRLTSTTGGSGIASSSIWYDGLGNITRYQSKNRDLDYTYNTSTNRLLYVDTYGTSDRFRNFNLSDSYDNRGNVKKNGEHTFTYNLANQMTSADGNISYLYDVQNRRVKTTSNGGVEISIYSLDGTLYYREDNGNGVNYIFLGDKLIAKDGKGVVDSSNSRMHYRPFGESIETPKDDVGYTGHKFDTDINLSYMQARYYDPVIGRFYSNDPVSYISENPVMSFNRYLYVNNNPFKYVDPDGRVLNSREAEQRAKLLEYINSNATDLYAFDNNGNLKKVDGGEGNGGGKSKSFTKALDTIIGHDSVVIVSIQQTFEGENLDSGHGGGAFKDEPHGNSYVFITGNSSPSMKSSHRNGRTRISLTPGEILAHELMDHALPHMLNQKGTRYKGVNSVLLDKGKKNLHSTKNPHRD